MRRSDFLAFIDGAASVVEFNRIGFDRIKNSEIGNLSSYTLSSSRAFASLDALKEFDWEDLIDSLNSSGSNVRAMAVGRAKKLGEIGLPIFIKLACDKDSEVYVAAIREISTFGKKSIPALSMIMSYPEVTKGASFEALRALKNMGGAAIDQLVEILESADDIIVASALAALGQIGTDRDDVKAKIIAKLEHANPFVRVRAIQALDPGWQTLKRYAEIEEYIIRAMQDQSEIVQQAARTIMREHEEAVKYASEKWEASTESRKTAM